MKTLFALLMLIAVVGKSYAAPASEESPVSPERVEALLALTKPESSLSAMYDGLEQAMRAGMQQAVEGKELTAEQQRVLDAAPAKLMNVLREELNWARMKPLIVQIYAESFSQEEVEGLIEFYGSPAGKAFIGKMPEVMQRSMQAGQSLAQQAMPRVQDAMKQILEEAKLAE